ncbi:bifunctional phosphoserine phosphatase/homoserine phosphotransferase ThrH [Spirochaeta africana]|uniref:bifunctional phosphoserine phosphatase/homoserine phosphotransferase ThrH n=1 Tax=Spirochaeta africana TaxID=46355 RepID=UPI0003015E2B
MIPEIWLGVAETTGIDDLRLTTRDIPDYDELMRTRLRILDDNGIDSRVLTEVAHSIQPLPGAREFLDRMRRTTQVVILSDTFRQFAGPAMAQLGYPTIFCNDLIFDDAGKLTDYKLRQQDGKRHAVLGFRSMNLKVLAAGDSYNDLSMILEADYGAFFRPPQSITTEHPELPVFTEYQPFGDALTQAVQELDRSN